MDESCNFDPVCFLRCHSRNNDSADIQTQVWQCAFEPNQDGIVATCGGNSVCIIDINSKRVLDKFYTKSNHLLYSLAWGKFRNRSLLAVGGSRSALYLFEPSLHVCLLMNEFKKIGGIHALLFHPNRSGSFFCGTSDGTVKQCVLSQSQGSLTVEVISTVSVNSEIFDFAFDSSSDSLYIAANDGLLLVTASNRDTDGPEFVSLKLPTSHKTNAKLVDSVALVGDGLIAVKPALHGCIYLLRMSEIVANLKTTPGLHSYDVDVFASLVWSDTDNYFMYMGVSSDGNLLCCGDDEGALWLYNLTEINRTSRQKLEPTNIIPWPALTDHYNDKKRKLNLEVYDIVIDKVAVSSDGSQLVAVTNNNLVCVWNKS